MTKRITLLSVLLLSINLIFSQAQNAANDTEAAALLQKMSEKYKSYKNLSAEFVLLIERPKAKPEDDAKKYTDTLKGSVLLQGNKFNVTIKEQQIICDGKNIWTYLPAEKEVQVNYFEESEDVFSPSKIFSLYKEGYLYQIKEKKVSEGKKLTVIEMSPSGKKVSFFKIDVAVDEATLQILSSRIYEKNGVRYYYKLRKQSSNVNTTDDSFTFDAKKYPGVKVVDLR